MSQPFITVMPPPFPFAGELAALCAALTWSVSISMYARFGRGIPPRALNLYKNLVALAALFVLLAAVRPELPSDPKDMLWLALSGVIGLSIGDSAFFGSLKRLGAQISTATQCLTPPLAAFIALVLLGEHLTMLEWAGMTMTLVAVGAVIVCNKRDGGLLAAIHGRELGIGLAGALIAALCQAAAVVISRFALQHTHVLVGTALRLVPAILVLYLSALTPTWGRPLAMLRHEKPLHLLLVGMAAVIGTCLGLLLLALGTKYAKAGIAAAISGTYPVWIIPLAGLFLSERVTARSVIFTAAAVGGMGLMLAGG